MFLTMRLTVIPICDYFNFRSVGIKLTVGFIYPPPPLKYIVRFRVLLMLKGHQTCSAFLSHSFDIKAFLNYEKNSSYPSICLGRLH